ncbi:member of major facilitator multidrug-resistance DHA1 sub-family [Punctularia strigosozonata HHB-11173 SS5]|uniref:Member of major facilitator multidrug-resistance DHA1 sub-family n=1 Tax=Punctularia strigosozonata (strain HHB-11173) TaxID=741275 RepID=R7S2L9_PUNST|nr:member of major facilitator multidrug-resistance DHA1 sub-family [Punctularia strigosozonata HHB-11173 SS5]EIN04032.1 member of major facilitator multidrug-resistance DHA1 sub-family [Punctularia strigosozonata HHB-11173 SS5]
MTVARDRPTDEETPLLDERHDKKPQPGPIPWNQFSIVLFLQLAEPLTSQVIYPFAPQLIRDLGITNGDEAKVGYYVGMMQSIFFATQAMTVMHWSRVSDYLGRKPVILTGLFGLSLSMYCFGLSKTFWGLVFSRSLNGALNGNIGVIKSMMAELMDSGNLAQAYAYMPIAWSTGGTLGPIIGGVLSRPAERFPSVFGNSDFLKEYPYFLPCAVPATFSVLAWLVTLLFLKETVRNPMPLSSLIATRKSKSNLALQTVAASTDPTASSIPSKTASDDYTPLPFRALLTFPVLVSAANYASLSLVDIAFRAIQPLFLSTPIALGGLGLPPHRIGAILSAFGILNGLFQVLWFAKIHDRWGAKRVFIAGIASAIPVFALFPVINALARADPGREGWLVWIAVAAQVVLSILISLSYGCIFIFISGSAPNRASLGATNGLCQMTVSIMRAIGPAAANSLFSLSIDAEHHYLDGKLVYVVMEVLVCVAVVIGCLLPHRVWTNGV